MTIKERLHKLVDELSDGEADEALRYIAQRHSDPVIAAFRDAPVDDERVITAIERLANDPHSAGLRKLTGRTESRLRLVTGA